MIEQIPLWQRVILGCAIGALAWSLYRMFGGKDSMLFMQIERAANDEYARDPVGYYANLQAGHKKKRWKAGFFKGMFKPR